MGRSSAGEGKPHRNKGRPLDIGDYQLLADFRFLLARFLAFSEKAAKAGGLAPRQHQALLAIKGYRGETRITVGDLAERLCIRHHSAVGLVDRLVASGHLVRCASTGDRRRMNLALTEKGEKVLADLSAAHREELRRMTPVLTPLLSKLEAPEDRRM